MIIEKEFDFKGLSIGDLILLLIGHGAEARDQNTYILCFQLTY
jgi:hypothetical protein